jgi:twitching motility protein PilT
MGLCLNTGGRTMVQLEELLELLVERGGSDLHIAAGAAPCVRIDGKLIPTDHPKFTPESSKALVYSILNNEQIARFEEEMELDLSFGMSGLGRFRTNVFLQRGAVGAVMRIIPFDVWPLDRLGLNVELIEEICGKPKGLVLVTGATGSGKSTTLAAMIDYINRTRSDHIVTIEDPIEFVHRNKSCLVNQREVGTDTRSFGRALRAVLREDPDVILIGEMRDQETIQAALTLAETGHLTFGTLHTSDCVQTINRIVDVFPAHQQQQIRTQLSFTIEAIFCQSLLPRRQSRGRVLACEVLVANSAVRGLIRDNKAHQMYSIIQTGARQGMMTLNQHLCELYRTGQIAFDDAIAATSDPDDLRRTFQMTQTRGAPTA